MKEKILNDYLLKQQKIDIEKVMDDFYSYVYIIARNSVSTCITEEDIEEMFQMYLWVSGKIQVNYFQLLR